MKNLRRIALFFLIIWLSGNHVHSQVNLGKSCREGLDSLDGKRVMTIVDTPPDYEGGMTLFYKLVRESLIFPDSVMGVSSRFILSFTIDTEGKATDICYVQPPYAFINPEMWVTLNSENKWKPGSQAGTAVPVRLVLPMYVEKE